MAKKSLLLVDADPRSLRVLEVSLRKAGYSVATCPDASAALETVDLSEPDLILSDTRLPGMNGFELVEELRKQPAHQTIPFMFLSSDSSVESKVRGLELGVEDYLTKPIYIKEIITRINLTLQRQEREGLAKRTSIAKTRFTGSLGDMGLVDLLQTIDISRKSGVLELTNEGHRGTISFREGQLVDAELGRLFGEAAIYRLLLWNEGEFELDFRPVRVEQRVRSSTQAILMEGMRRIDEWGRLLEQIPSLDNIFEVSDEELVERLAEIPDEINQILKHIDGRRSLIQVVDACDGDDLETLTAITKLYFEGIVYPTGRTHDGTDEKIDDELLVGEEPMPYASGVVAPSSGSANDELVPRTPTLAPPALAPVDREKTNGDDTAGDTYVSARASDLAPDPAHADADLGDRDGGTTTAVAAADAAESPASVDEVSEPTQTLETGATENDSLSDDDEAPEDEDMARKGRRRRNRKATTSQGEAELQQESAQQESAEQESANNVIQFPAQSKRGVASAQVAVNDGVVGVDDDEADEGEGASARADDTRTVKREEPEVPAKAKAEPPKPEEPEAAAEEAKAEPAQAESAEATSAEAESAEAESAPEEPEEPEGAKAEAPEPEVQKVSDQASVQSTGRGKKKKNKKGKGRPSDAPPARKSDSPIEAKATPATPSEPPPARREKKRTSTSAEIRAVTMTGEHAEVAEDFFRKEKEAKVEHETWDDLEKDALPLPEGMKKARNATFAIFAAGFLLIGGYVVYQNFIMPQPVPLSGSTRPPELPTGFQEPGETRTAAAQETPPPVRDEVVAEGEGEEVVAEGEGEEVVAEGEGEEVVAEGEGEEVVAEGEGEALVAEGEGEEVVAEAEPTPPPVAEAPPPAADVDARAVARNALRELNRRRNQEAADLAQQAVRADQTVALGWLVLGAARQELRDAVGAREAYQSCVEHGQGREVRDCRAMLR